MQFYICIYFVQWSAFKHVLWMMWRNKKQPKECLLLYFIPSHGETLTFLLSIDFIHPPYFFVIHSTWWYIYSDGFHQFYCTAFLALKSETTKLNEHTHTLERLYRKYFGTYTYTMQPLSFICNKSKFQFYIRFTMPT